MIEPPPVIRPGRLPPPPPIEAKPVPAATRAMVMKPAIFILFLKQLEYVINASRSKL
jgi:hypothetical protein